MLDKDYIAQHTLGFEALQQRVQEWPPQRVAEICGITVEEVEGLARDYGKTALRGETTMIRTNYGLQRVHGGGMAVRNIACLPATARFGRKTYVAATDHQHEHHWRRSVAAQQ